MSRYITIEFDPTEVRVAVGSSGLTSGVSVEHAVSAPLSLDSNEDVLGSVKTFQAIQGLLKQIGVRSGNAIVCVGRNAIELRSMTLPTVDKNELPDMVRFAAQRQFANTGDSWPVDFILMPSNQEGMTDCLAATINPAIVDRIGKIVESLGLTLAQIVLRPMASATMAIVKQPQLAGSNVLLLELFRDEADMTIVERGNVVFMRNVRFSQPLEGGIHHPSLVAEIKRTLIAAASQRTDLSVEQIRIWGSEAQYADACKSLSESLQNQVSVIDPFELLDVSKTVRNEAGGNTGKYASSVGALLGPQLSDRLIDFSHPRKRVEKERPIRKYAMAGIAAAVLLGAGYAWYWSSHASLNNEIAKLNEAISKNNDLLKASSKKLSDWRKIESFLAGDYNWLDELEYLSQHADSGDKVVFRGASFTLDAKNEGSTISTGIMTKEQEDIPGIEKALRDENHTVLGTMIGKSQDKTGMFPTFSDLNIKIAPRKVEDPRKSAPAKTSKPSENKAASENKAPAENKAEALPPSNLGAPKAVPDAEPSNAPPKPDSKESAPALTPAAPEKAAADKAVPETPTLEKTTPTPTPNQPTPDSKTNAGGV
ncbi:MAG: hypothetical protein ABL921_10315 [Pirellula sp.]